MNRLFLINGRYYVMAFDYYDAIVKYKDYWNCYDEKLIQSIELISEDIINMDGIVEKKIRNEDYDEDYDDEE